MLSSYVITCGSPEGIRFNNYNVEAQCTPTRSAILTGRHPVRSGTFRVPWPGEGAAGLCTWEYTRWRNYSPTRVMRRHCTASGSSETHKVAFPTIKLR